MENKTKKCSHCKSEIDKDAKRCPKCQADLRNWFRRHIILSIIGGIILLLVMVGIMGNSGPSKIGENSVIGNTAKQQVFKIGDQIKRKDTVLSVVKVVKDWKSSNIYDKPSNPNDIFVVITISFENQGSSQLSLSSFWDFKLEDANGVQRNEALAGIGLNKLNSGSVTSLSPGGKISGDLIFEVPQNAISKLTLDYQPLLDFGESAKIELQ